MQETEQPTNKRTNAYDEKTEPSVTVGEGFWTLTSKGFSQAAQLGIFFAAARFLTPYDFGLYALVSATAVITIILAEGGWAEFIMKSDNGADHFNEVVTASILSGALLGASVCAAGLILWRGFDLSTAGTLLTLFSALTMLSGISAPYRGALVASRRLRLQAFIRIAAELLGLTVTGIGFLAGWGAAALVLGKVSTQFVIFTASFRAVHRKVSLRLSPEVAVMLFTFAKHIVANRVVAFVASYSGTLAIGGFLGVAEAGYYRIAERLVLAISELIGEPARMLAWSVFRQARQAQDKGAIQAVTLAITRFVTLLITFGMPLYIGLALLSQAAVALLLGEAWLPASGIVTILCFRQLLLLPGMATEPLLTVMGYVHKRLAITILNVIVSLVLILTLAPHGIKPLALGQCFGAVLASTMTIWLQTKYAQANWIAVAKEVVALAAVPSLAMIITVLQLENVNFSELPWLAVFTQVASGATVYISLFLLIYMSRRFFEARQLL